MEKFQFAVIGRTDDVSNIEGRDLLFHDDFDFGLKTKVKWIKNVMEERGCPDQALLGAHDIDLCILLGHIPDPALISD